jgi:hypothetical protein
MEDLLSLVGSDVHGAHRRSISAVRQECRLDRATRALGSLLLPWAAAAFDVELDVNSSSSQRGSHVSCSAVS